MPTPPIVPGLREATDRRAPKTLTIERPAARYGRQKLSRNGRRGLVIGLFLLIGVVMKNTILIVDLALAGERERGLSPREAVIEAARLRLRAILMTSVAALFGTAPLLLSGGEGWEMRRPLGLAIVGGLVVSQCLTLYTTPAIYLLMARLRRRAAAPSGCRPAAV